MSTDVITLDAIKPQTILDAFRFSTIAFHADLSKKDAAIVPLGVMVEIYIPKRLYALGLIARTELSSDELALASEFVKPLVARPFEYLAGQFKKAWDALASGEALENLAAAHAYSAVQFSIPDQFRVPLFTTSAEPVLLRANVRMQIGTFLDNQMGQLLEMPTIAVPKPRQPQEEILRLRGQAA